MDKQAMEEILPMFRVDGGDARTVSLTNNGIERYSPSERALFTLLPKNGEPVTSTVLLKQLYNGRRMRVNARLIMNVHLKRLMNKVKHNREPFRVMRSKGSQPKLGRPPIAWRVRLLP